MVHATPWSMTFLASRTAAMPASRLPRSTGIEEPEAHGAAEDGVVEEFFLDMTRCDQGSLAGATADRYWKT